MKRIVFALPLLVFPAMVLCSGGHDHGTESTKVQAHHGGQVVRAGDSHFEVIFADKGLHVIPMTARGEALSARNLTGEVTIRSRKSRGETMVMEAVRGKDGLVSHLMLMQDFSAFKDGSRKASFILRGLPGGDQRFSTVLRRATPMAQGGEMSAAAGCCPGGSKGSMAGSHSEQEMAGSHSGHDMNSMGGGKAAMSKAADAASMDAKRRAYPLDWCVVTGESLGADGEPVEIMHEGRLIRLCCKGCVGKFQRDPAKFLAKLDAAKRGEKVQRPAGSGSAATHGGDDHSGHSH